ISNGILQKVKYQSGDASPHSKWLSTLQTVSMGVEAWSFLLWRFDMRTKVMAVVCLLLSFSSVRAVQPVVEKGSVRFEPAGDQQKIPKRYRLEAHRFDYQLEHMDEMPLSGLDIFHLTFPSPVKSPCKENNSVHAEYYRPRCKGKFPCVIVLDITGGDEKTHR